MKVFVKNSQRRLTLSFGLGQADGAFAFLPFAAFFHELYALKALHY